MFRRSLLLIASLLLLMSAPVTQAQTERDLTDYEQTLRELSEFGLDMVQRAARPNGLFTEIAEHGDPLYIAPLIDLLYFSFGNANITAELHASLSQLTGIPETDWVGYLEWASENDITLPPGYDTFKGRLLSGLIDERFTDFFINAQETANINMVEAVWGGVRVDGIPSLVNARQISPEQAIVESDLYPQFCSGDCTYPEADEFVFGVEIDGDARAYPLRILNWHEMFNDVIGHTPLLDAPNGEQLCHFRAPTVFNALARSGDDYVLINGESAGCLPEGWVAVDAVEWIDSDWDSVSLQLPDVTSDADALPIAEGIQGRVIGRPVMLAYCTLCGAGILYDVTIPDLTYTDRDSNTVDLGETVLEFGSTGMLMRSNKLMYDRNTNTVWNAFTGIPAFGPLASTDLELPLLPVVVTTWDDWLESHPDTSVLSLDTGFRRDYTNGAAYSDYFNSPDLMFPSFQQNTENADNKEMVFGLNLDNNPRAYPLATLSEQLIVNDVIDDVTVVIISDALPERDFFEPGGAAVRAYERGELTFSQDDSGQLVDDDGTVWQLTEDALIAEDGRTLERIAGHLAFWFGWYGFYPETDLFTVSS